MLLYGRKHRLKTKKTEESQHQSGGGGDLKTRRKGEPIAPSAPVKQKTKNLGRLFKTRGRKKGRTGLKTRRQLGCTSSENWGIKGMRMTEVHQKKIATNFARLGETLMGP